MRKLIAIVSIVLAMVFLVVSITPPAKAEVVNSDWDGSVRQVEKFLDTFLRDPGSRKDIKWYPVSDKYEDGNYLVRYDFRAKNGFGGYEVNHWFFVIASSDEKVVLVTDAHNIFDIIYAEE